jgi:hypothetical protein
MRVRPQTFYLTFNEPDDYLAWLKANDPLGGTPPMTRLEIAVQTVPHDNQYHIRPIYYYAVATQRIGDVIGVYDVLLYATDSLDVNLAANEAKRTQQPNRIWRTVQERFAKEQERWLARGVIVERGKWTHETPELLRAG